MGRSRTLPRTTGGTARTARGKADIITGILPTSTFTSSGYDDLVASTSANRHRSCNGGKVLSVGHLGLYRRWQRDYTRQVNMPAMPLQNQSSQTLGAAGATPDS